MSRSVLKPLLDTVAAYRFFIGLCTSQKTRAATPTTGKHLLLLAWAFPPDVTGGVYRPISIVRRARQRGWTVTVICGPAPNQTDAIGAHLEQFAGHFGDTLRVEDFALHPSYKLFVPRLSGGLLNIKTTIELVMQRFAKTPPSVILASGPPFHNFVAARQLSNMLGIPYVLDYRDEWTECPFEFVDTGNVDRYFERLCIRDAKRIIFTTQSHLAHQQRVFNIRNDTQLVLIANGWESEEAAADQVISPLPKTECRLAFVGYLGDHTLPKAFLQTLQACLDQHPEWQPLLKISFIGNKSKQARAQLLGFKYSGVVELVEAVPKPVATRIMMDAAGLIVINEERLFRYRPGKLYDYIAMKKPILVFGGGGEIEHVVGELDAGEVVRTREAAEMNAALSRLINRPAANHSQAVDAWLAQHTRVRSADKIFDLLDAVVATPLVSSAQSPLAKP